MSKFGDLTGVDERGRDGNMTPEGIEAIRHAVAVLLASEEFSEDMESANHHSMDWVLREFADGLHVHEYPAEPSYTYDYGSEYQCKQCPRAMFVEGGETDSNKETP